MLNKYQWENYLLSGGNKIVTIFQDFLNCENLDKFTSTIKTLVNDFCPDKNRGVELEKRLNKKEQEGNPLALSFIAYKSKRHCFCSAVN